MITPDPQGLIRLHVCIENTGQRSAYARNVYTCDRRGGVVAHEVNPHLPPYLRTNDREATRAAAAVWLQEPGTVAVFQGYTHHFRTGPSPFQWAGPLYTLILPGAEYGYSIILSNPLEEWEKNWVPEALLAPVPVERIWLRVETSRPRRSTGPPACGRRSRRPISSRRGSSSTRRSASVALTRPSPTRHPPAPPPS